ncbi:MAG: PIN domain-containing protein [Candidatus Scalindua sp.]|nr:PIN domain-containing protein [Candidatus Scalindua sp.]
MIYLDTHVVAWLYAGRIDLFPDHIQKLISREELFISPIVSLELQYLFEIGRVLKKAKDVVSDLEKRIGLNTCECAFNDVIECTITHDWTRDPFDRIIVSQANVHSTKLVTKDETIRKNYKYAIW